MRRLINLEGQKFNRLTIIKRVYKENCKKTLWLCKCDCGNEDIVEGYALRNGDVKSCGCYRDEVTKAIRKTHGHAHIPIYNVWCSMRARCKNPNNHAYKDYGGRGIEVCNDWKSSFEIFYEWAIANGYKKGLTIERINVNGNYEPSNCKWIGMLEQQNNRRNNRFILYQGEKYTVSQLARKLEKPYKYVYARYCRDYAKEREKRRKNETDRAHS